MKTPQLTTCRCFVVATVALAALPVSQAQAGWYVGADIATMNTSFDHNAGGERYATNHVRAKLGYAYNDYFGFEARVMSSGDNSDLNPSQVQFRWQTGTVASAYLRPSMPLGKLNFYGLIGASFLDTTYTNLASNQFEAEKVTTLDFGLGAEYFFSRTFAISLEAKVFSGSADYSAFFPTPDSVTLSGTTFGLGAVFRF